MKKAIVPLLLLVGCLAGEEVDVSTETSAIYVPPVPPLLEVVKVDFFVLDDSPTGCAAAATDAAIAEGVRLANESWAIAGLRFSISGIRRIHAPHFQYMSSTELSVADIAGELPILGFGVGTELWQLASWGVTMTNEAWLDWTADRAIPLGTPIFVPCEEDPERWWGHVGNTGTPRAYVHLPAAWVGSSLLGWHLGHALELY